MASTIEKLDLENDLVQLLITEAVKVAMKSPLRDPILEAIEGTTGETREAVEGTTGETREAIKGTTGETLESTNEDEASGTREKSRRTKVIQGGTVFVVMFVVLYVALRRLTSDEPNA